jgi:ATP-dependent Clp protease, protease subunit
LEQDMDVVLARLFGASGDKIAAWMKPGRYVTGPELAAAGLAELVDLLPVSALAPPAKAGGAKRKGKR